MKACSLPGVFHWNRFQPDRAIDFNGFFFQGRKGGLLIDPLNRLGAGGVLGYVGMYALAAVLFIAAAWVAWGTQMNADA